MLSLTKPELVLLSKFQTPSLPRAYGVNGFWEGVLGKPPENVIQRFISQGLIIEAPTETDVNNLSVKEIKAHLKTMGMTVSGKREELVRRLAAVEALPSVAARDEPRLPICCLIALFPEFPDDTSTQANRIVD